MSFSVGETVGPYRIIEQLGQGGMATVFKAYHAALDRYVAIKVLHPAFQEDSNFLARFQREARLVAKLEHPNIVPIYDYTEHEGRPYLVMKFIEGETLKAQLSRAPLTKGQIAAVVEAVGAGLAYAHKRGILHRDIKPSNVLMATDGQIFLSDFGLARIAQSGESTLTSDMILGTPQYISPEQALGKKDLDEGTDIYSFGVMLYELIVGQVPYSADTPFSVIHDHIYTPLPLPHTIKADVPESVERFLLKTLSKERKDRYKDVPAMLEAFRAVWAEEPDTPTIVQTPKPVPAQPTALEAATAPVVLPPAPPPVEPPTVTVKAAAATAVAAEAGSDKIMPAPVSEKKKSGLGWMWAAAGLALVLACLVTLLAIRSILRTASSLPSASVPTAQASVSTPVQNLTPVSDLTKAQEAATQDPSNPKTALRLALASANAGQTDAARTLIFAAEKSGHADANIYWDFGRQFAGAGFWVEAARLDLDAAQLQVKNGGLSNDQNDQFHEAVYRAFADKAAVDFVPPDQIAAIDKPLATVAKTRFEFTFGDRAKAQGFLDQLKLTKPNYPDAQLLQAEFFAKNGEIARARLALKDLRANPNAAAWMLAEAKSIEGTLP